MPHRLNDHQTSVKGKEDTAVHAHHILTGHTIDFRNAKIIDRADTYRKLQLKKLMHIDVVEVCSARNQRVKRCV